MEWAAAATGPPRACFLLGVKAVIAESFERIHRSNLVGMGVLPLVFKKGDNRANPRHRRHRLFPHRNPNEPEAGTGREGLHHSQVDGKSVDFLTTCRIDTPVEIEYYKNGGILQTVLRRLLKA